MSMSEFCSYDPAQNVSVSITNAAPQYTNLPTLHFRLSSNQTVECSAIFNTATPLTSNGSTAEGDYAFATNEYNATDQTLPPAFRPLPGANVKLFDFNSDYTISAGPVTTYAQGSMYLRMAINGNYSFVLCFNNSETGPSFGGGANTLQDLVIKTPVSINNNALQNTGFYYL